MCKGYRDHLKSALTTFRCKEPSTNNNNQSFGAGHGVESTTNALMSNLKARNSSLLQLPASTPFSFFRLFELFISLTSKSNDRIFKNTFIDWFKAANRSFFYFTMNNSILLLLRDQRTCKQNFGSIIFFSSI